MDTSEVSIEKLMSLIAPSPETPWEIGGISVSELVLEIR